MNIDEIKAVIDVSRFNSFAEAAEYESVSPSVISKYVSRVEEELGVVIFERATKSKPVVLTDAGKLIIKDLRNMVSDYTSMLATVSSLENTVMPPLSVGYTPSIGHYREDRITAEYIYRNRMLHVRMIEGGIDKLLNCLMTNVADVLLLRLCAWDFEPTSEIAPKLFNPELELVSIRRQRGLNLMVNKKNPLAKKKELTSADLPEVRKNVLLLNSRSTIFSNENNKKRAFDFFGGIESFQTLLVDLNKPFVLLDMMDAHEEMVLPVCPFEEFDIPNFTMIPVKDWNLPMELYMIYRKSNGSKSLLKFVTDMKGMIE